MIYDLFLVPGYEFELLAGALSTEKGFQLDILQWNCSSSLQIENNVFFTSTFTHVSEFQSKAEINAEVIL